MVVIRWLLVLVLLFVGGLSVGHGMAWMKHRWFAAERVQAGDFQAHFDAGSPTLILYATTTCPWCKKTRAWLDQHQLAYELRLIDEDARHRDRYRQLQQAGVPVLISRDRLLDGYDEPALAVWLAD